MESIFISYRRSDAAGYARQLFDRLRQWFDTDQLFFDQNTVEIGAVLPERIQEAVDAAKIVLVVIGPDWLRTLNERVDDTNIDYVRAEVARALVQDASTRKQRIVPILMAGAKLPSVDDLHEELHAQLSSLCTLNAHSFGGHQSSWDLQFDRLLDYIASVDGVPAPQIRAFPPFSQQSLPTLGKILHDSACFLSNALTSSARASSDERRKVSDYLIDVGEVLSRTSTKLRVGSLPHEECAELSMHLQNLLAVIEPIKGSGELLEGNANSITSALNTAVKSPIRIVQYLERSRWALLGNALNANAEVCVGTITLEGKTMPMIISASDELPEQVRAAHSKKNITITLDVVKELENQIATIERAAGMFRGLGKSLRTR